MYKRQQLIWLKGGKKRATTRQQRKKDRKSESKKKKKEKKSRSAKTMGMKQIITVRIKHQVNGKTKEESTQINTRHKTNNEQQMDQKKTEVHKHNHQQGETKLNKHAQNN